MEEIELTSAVQILILRNKGYRFKHIKTGNIYTLITNIKSKNPLNGDWYDAFLKENPIFKTLPIEEQEDMEKQLEYMRSYSSTLINRLLRAGVDVLKTN